VLHFFLELLVTRNVYPHLLKLCNVRNGICEFVKSFKNKMASSSRKGLVEIVSRCLKVKVNFIF